MKKTVSVQSRSSILLDHLLNPEVQDSLPFHHHLSEEAWVEWEEVEWEEVEVIQWD